MQEYISQVMFFKYLCFLCLPIWTGFIAADFSNLNHFILSPTYDFSAARFVLEVVLEGEKHLFSLCENDTAYLSETVFGFFG